MAKQYENFDDVKILEAKIDKILNEKQPMTIKDLKVNGNDLIKLGFKQGKDLGLILSDLLELVLQCPEMNDRDKLLNLALSNYDKN
jgi:tRNA nucleotidyltransferase (CCA-adding enzyme)